MTEQRNVEILRAIYEKWGDRTLEPRDWMEVLDDDVQWRSIGDGVPGIELSSPIRSRSEVARYFEELANEWEMIHYTADEFVAQGDRVVMIGRCGWRNKRTGKPVETPKVDLFRMREGKVTDFYELFDTAKALEATRADEPPVSEGEPAP